MDGSLTLRSPPAALEAEQAVLGGIMLAGTRALDEVADLLTEESFFGRRHQLIFRAIHALSAHSKRFDAVTLGDWLCKKGYADEIDGGAYLTEISSTTPSAANVRAYAKIVAEKALRRRLVECGMRITDAGFSGDGDAIDAVG